MKHIAKQFPLPHMPAPAKLRLLHPYPFVRGCGDSIMLGICPVCGRNVTRSSANRIGGTCRFDGSQFDAAGNLVRLGPFKGASGIVP